jgi:hypothetical protein
MCENYNALPDAGGINDQDYVTMHRMGVLANVHRVVSRTRNLQGAQIHQLTISERRTLRWLRDNGMM